MRKVVVTVTTRLVINMEEGIELQEVINEMDYDFISQTVGASIVDTEIQDYDIQDSK